MADVLENTKSLAKALFKRIKGSTLNYESFMNELQEKSICGQLIVQKGDQSFSILILKGTPVLTSGGHNLKNALTLIKSPHVRLDFFALDPKLTLSYSSTINGKQVWDRPSLSKEQIQRALIVAKKKRVTGHLNIHRADGSIHRLFITDGIPLGMFNVEQGWVPVKPGEALKDSINMSFFIGTNLNKLSALCKKSVHKPPQIDKNTLRAQNIEKFLHSWSDFTVLLTDKIGQRLVEKSLKKHFGKCASVLIRGITLYPAVALEDVSSEDVILLGQSLQQFISATSDISGKHWLNEQKAHFAEKHSKILEYLHFTQIFTS